MKQEAFNRLLRELDAKRSITVKRAKELYGADFSESTWKRLKKTLERVHDCKLTWDAKAKSFKVPSTWTLYPSIDPGKRDQLAVLRAAAALVGPPLTDQISAFIDKLDRELEQRDPESHAKSPLRQPAPRADKDFFTRLNSIEMAIRRRNIITIGYRKSAGGKLEERTIAPYEIHNHAGRFYVWATDEGGSKPKFFALDRIESLSSDVDDRFDREPRLSLDEELRHSFGIWVGPGRPQTIEVEIRENRSADVRARRWPAERSCTTLPDGHVRLTFSVTDPREIVAWVLSFGGDAWIRQPAAAAKLAYELAQKAAASHKWAQDVPEDERLLRFDWGVDGLPLERRASALTSKAPTP
jgi:predicted DNA-binding transcriptional regulator YafY